MKNILATSGANRFAGMRASTLALTIFAFVMLLWSVWASHELLRLSKREVVTIQLSRLMGDFVESEARSGQAPEDTRERVQFYLKAVEASVEQLEHEGRVVLVAEAVIAGGVRDLTEEVRADVARRLGAAARATR